MKNLLLLLITCMMFAGCGNAAKYARISSPIVGCPPDEIEIEHGSLIPRNGAQEWEAVCNGKRHLCKQSSSGVSCAEMFTPFVLEKAPASQNNASK